jgi:peroxiredoxin Q/BCP
MIVATVAGCGRAGSRDWRETSRRRPGVLAGAFLAATIAAGCAGPVRRPDGGVGLLPAGAAAPEVVGRDRDGRDVSLSALRGKPIVVYFYPKDGSPNCTQEACAFRDVWTRYTDAGVTVIGVSRDSVESHTSFIRDEKLPFALASDPSGVVATSYGVRKLFFGDDRVTFLVDRSGHVARVWPRVDPGTHAREVIEAAQALP